MSTPSPATPKSRPARVDDALVLALVRDRLRAFTVFVDQRYQVEPVHAQIAAALQRVESGACRRLMIWAPPRVGKTHLTSCLFPAWYLGRHPDRRVICATYSAELAAEWGARVRSYCSMKRVRAAFPELRLTGGRANDKWELSAGGGFRAVGTGGSVTGKGASLFVIDDAHKGAAEADSVAHRHRVQRWYQWDALTRLEPNGAMIIMQTRWDEDDLSGWLLREGSERWEVLCLPALDAAGKALCPGRGFDEATYARIRGEVSERAWEALYMQRPAPPQGSIFLRSWWRYHDDADCATGEVQPTPAPGEFDLIWQSWDPKLKDVQGATASYAVGQVWGRRRRKLYLLDQVREQRGFEWMLDEVGRLLTVWPRCSTVLIEDAAAGPPALEVLRSRYGSRVRLVRAKPTGSKRQRAEAASPMVREGNVLLPTLRRSPWVAEFVEELACFRGHDRDDDDQVDALTQAVQFAGTAPTAMAVPDISMVQANPWH